MGGGLFEIAWQSHDSMGQAAGRDGEEMKI